MVRDRVTDGNRIAELLASELTGLSRGPLAEVSVVDARPGVEPAADGAFAYGIAFDGERVGDVYVHESAARLEFHRGTSAVLEQDAGPGLSVEPANDGVRILVETGAAVKRASDLVAAACELGR